MWINGEAAPGKADSRTQRGGWGVRTQLLTPQHQVPLSDQVHHGRDGEDGVVLVKFEKGGKAAGTSAQ